MKLIRYIQLLFVVLAWNVAAQSDSRGAITTKVATTSGGQQRALVIGISDYLSSDLKLNFADNDAYMFKNFLTQIEKVNEENISFLVNEEATGIRIAQELKNIYAQSVSGDIVYIYFAGHGDVVDDFDEKIGYLLAADANAKQEYNGVGGVVPLAYLNEKVLPKLAEKGVKVFLVLDACKSGFIYKEGTQKNMGAIQSMFEQSIKFLSCGPNELSYESSELKHGYFTYYLIKGMAGEADSNADNKLQFNEIDDYLYTKVNTSVSQKYHQNQIPSVKTQNNREVFLTVNQNDKGIVFENLPKQTSTIPSRERGVLTKKSNNDESIQLNQEFTNALLRKDLFGKPNSALAIFYKAKENPKISSEFKEAMHDKLIEKLAFSAQSLLNDYINGNKDLPLANEFLAQAKQLEICLQLMDKTDYMYSRYEASKLLLEAFAVIRSKNYQGIKNAKKKLVIALSIEPKAAYLHNAMGLLYSMEQKNDSAHYHFNVSRKLIASWSTPIHNLSDNLMLQNKREAAKQLINESLGVGVKDANTFVQLGLIYENEGIYQLAEEYYKKAIEMQPNSPYIAQKLSRLYQSKGNEIESQKWFDKAIQSDALASLLDVGIASYCKAKKMDTKQTEAIFIQAIEEHPDLSELYTQYADFLVATPVNSHKKIVADSLYSKAIALDPHNITATTGKGWLYFKMRKKIEAQKIMEALIQTNPTHPLAYVNYGHFLQEALHDDQGAKQNYQKAIALDELYLPAYKKLIALLLQQNQTDHAIQLLSQILEKHKDVPDLWNLLGDCNFHKGLFTEAIQAYSEAIKRDITYTKSYAQLGRTELETNQYEDSKKNYLLANIYNPYLNKKGDIAAYIIAMAKEKERFGTPSQTQNLYKLAYEIDPTTANGTMYAHYLYLHQAPQEAIAIGLTLLQNENSKKEQNSIYKLLLKAAIDLSDKKGIESYSKKVEFNDYDQMDVLLTGVYCYAIGNESCFKTSIAKVNQRLLTSIELKEYFSTTTIQRIVLGAK